MNILDYITNCRRGRFSTSILRTLTRTGCQISTILNTSPYDAPFESAIIYPDGKIDVLSKYANKQMAKRGHWLLCLEHGGARKTVRGSNTVPLLRFIKAVTNANASSKKSKRDL